MKFPMCEKILYEDGKLFIYNNTDKKYEEIVIQSLFLLLDEGVEIKIEFGKGLTNKVL